MTFLLSPFDTKDLELPGEVRTDNTAILKVMSHLGLLMMRSKAGSFLDGFWPGLGDTYKTAWDCRKTFPNRQQMLNVVS